MNVGILYVPEIYNYKCNACGFLLSSGWGGYVYVENDRGERIQCPHPGERLVIERVLKIQSSADQEERGKRYTGNEDKDRLIRFLERLAKFSRQGFPEEVKDIVSSRIGFNFHCICLDCLHSFNADIGDERLVEQLRKRCPDLLDGHFYKYYSPKRSKDERKCPKCGSENIKAIFELVEQACPVCREGVIQEISTGIIS